ncbi:MAG TPA: hypothetical protein VHE58_06670 [Burkholderiales bacterium]|nr:hypothetical protein [Burkholderiales bacterium]
MPVVERAHERGVLLKLFPVVLLLAVEEFFQVAAFGRFCNPLSQRTPDAFAYDCSLT